MAARLSHALHAATQPSADTQPVVIVGAGPAGCATALALARNDPSTSLRVLLLDDADPTAYKIGESLPASARRTLATLHPSLNATLAQDTLQGLHHVCTGTASAWAGAALQETYALMNPYGAGWHLDRARFDETLRAACAPVLRKARFVAVRRCTDGGAWEVDAEMAPEGAVETFRARWVVDATGRKASVARKLGAKTHKHSDLLSFYALFTTPAGAAPTPDSDGRTLIEAARAGWWYTAPLPHARRLVMYTTAPTDASARAARGAAGFADMLRTETRHVARALGGASSDIDIDIDDTDEEEARVEYEMEEQTRFVRHTSACSAVLAPYAAWEPHAGAGDGDRGEAQKQEGRGWCAVGDAALAFDPLSSQGIVTALDAGAFLGGVLARHLGTAEGGPLGGEGAVRAVHEAYERVRAKYEEGRAYYYGVVRRFDKGGGGEEEEEQGKGFWEKLRGE
ncbi:uncharacterized protein PHACADRAFT_188170 [Phanerochaete carnosa HHB-10118-sp]|uniref:FAD-binding domain-containing protein n=1 Tax=Phanerochaete carnosa (strain HHB-10118-sp) TaxID=650164 RepID=K5VHB8_PHACS|nr:uncharacterized protein PHACADRAFT_188170 [Phanerochaete carnosa HHB-10118-sp]EKM50628.1 hypothetical protein PHACADRAFT_188170 [Phanerochaete carnosa HHB-10118-sp]